jgi:hypothetical protein
MTIRAIFPHYFFHFSGKRKKYIIIFVFARKSGVNPAATKTPEKRRHPPRKTDKLSQNPLMKQIEILFPADAVSGLVCARFVFPCPVGKAFEHGTAIRNGASFEHARAAAAVSAARGAPCCGCRRNPAENRRKSWILYFWPVAFLFLYRYNKIG